MRDVKQQKNKKHYLKIFIIDDVFIPYEIFFCCYFKKAALYCI